MSIRELVKSFTPPVALQLRRRLLRRDLRFSRPMGGWTQALSLCSGYAHHEILERVQRAARAVVSGQAAFERDSVLFDEFTFPYPLLCALLRAAALNAGRLRVIDFGGSLGSTYFQCRPFLAGLREVQWHVVEQPHYVAAGRDEFETDQLNFFSSLADVPPEPPNGIILACSTLQYLENPWRILEQFAQRAAQHLVIDRTPTSNDSRDSVRIQRAPRDIYKATYPAWIFSRTGLLAALSRHWRLVGEYLCDDGPIYGEDGLRIDFRGMILQKLPAKHPLPADALSAGRSPSAAL